MTENGLTESNGGDDRKKVAGDPRNGPRPEHLAGSHVEAERRDPQRTTKHIVSLAKTTYRWCHRNPFVAALSAVSAATLLIGMAVFMHTITKSDRDADASPLNRPEQQTAKAEPGEELAEQRRIEADNNNSRRAARELYGAHMKLAQIAWDDSRPGEIVRLLDLYRPAIASAAGDTDLRGFEWYYWDRLTSRSNESVLNAGDPASESEPLTLKSNAGGIRSVAFSPDGKSLASASQSGAIKIWDPATGLLKLSVGDRQGDRLGSWSETSRSSYGPASSTSRSSDGPAVAGDPRRIYHSVNDSQLFRSVSATNELPGTEIRSHADVVPPFSASAGVGHHLNMGAVAATSVAFSPNENLLASADCAGCIKVWHSTSLHTALLMQHSTEINGLTFSRDGIQLASAGKDGSISIWQAKSGQRMLVIQGHSGWMKSVAFSPDGFSLASACSDGSIKLWDATNGYDMRTFMGHTGMATSVVFSPDGERLASASNDQTVKVWDANTGQALQTLQGHTGTVTSVAFSPDGQRLASGSYDQTVKVWDASSGMDLLTLKGHTGTVTSVAFSPDGQRLVSGSYDQTLKIWDARCLETSP